MKTPSLVKALAIKISPFLDQGGNERLYSSDKNELTASRYKQSLLHIKNIHRDLPSLTLLKGIWVKLGNREQSLAFA